MCSGVSLEIKRVIEALTTDAAAVAFNVAVAFHVAFKHSGFRKGLGTQ